MSTVARTRAAHACNRCSRLKKKCSGERPCKKCVKDGHLDSCSFSPHAYGEASSSSSIAANQPQMSRSPSNGTTEGSGAAYPEDAVSHPGPGSPPSSLWQFGRGPHATQSQTSGSNVTGSIVPAGPDPTWSPARVPPFPRDPFFPRDPPPPRDPPTRSPFPMQRLPSHPESTSSLGGALGPEPSYSAFNMQHSHSQSSPGSSSNGKDNST